MDRACYISPRIAITLSLLMRTLKSSKGDDVHIYFNFSIKLVGIGDIFFYFFYSQKMIAFISVYPAFEFTLGYWIF